MTVIVLTGSIGMGKSATAKLFADEGARVWDADAAVHRLYEKDGAAVHSIEAIAPEAIRDGAVDRAALSAAIAKDASLLKKIEAVVHPLVAADREAALADGDPSTPIVLDIPLFFEGGGAAGADAVVVVTAPDEVRRARVLERPGMSAEKLDFIISRQTPDTEKRRRADYIIWTHDGLEPSREAVRAILRDLALRAG